MVNDRVKILVTDTNMNILNKLEHDLADFGFDVYVENSASKILLSLKTNCFDLILLDVTIPELNVLNIIESIHSINTHTAIITTNDAANYDLAIETVRRGAFDMLIKPYETVSLINIIQDALDNSAQIMQDKSIVEEIEPTDNIYQFMIENSQDIQYILDDEGKFTFINKIVETLLGYSRSELLGKHYTELVYSDDLDKAVFRLHDKRSNNPLSQSVELRLKCKKNNPGYLYFEIMSMAMPRPINNEASEPSTANKSMLNETATFGIAHDVTIRKKVEQIVHKKASYDHLTSLPNNILFHDRLNLAIAHAKRDDTVFAVMYLDLDGFKAINDMYGHHIGDKVLQTMSSRLLNCLRESDTLARVGGDEFTLLLPHVSNNQEAAIIANKLTTSTNKPFMINGVKHRLSVSIGIAFFPDDGDSRELLIQASDKAMYKIKNGQKNGYEFHRQKVLN